MTSFVSVSTSAARYQDISLNPQKLAGQCAKLKCCLNYEVDCYVEAQKRLPSKEIELETKDGTFYFFKADILSNQISYSTDKNFPANLVTISGKRAFEVISMNRKGMKPDSLFEEERKPELKKPIVAGAGKALPALTVTAIKRVAIMRTGIIRRRKKELITTTALNRLKTLTEEKERTDREIIIIGTEDRIRDGIMKTDDRKEE